MQITLNQDEIHEAVAAYINNQIAIQPTQSISIDFTMGRTPNGLTASIDIRASKGSPVAAQTAQAARTNVKSAPVTPAAAPEAEASVVEEAAAEEEEASAIDPAPEAEAEEKPAEPVKKSPFKIGASKAPAAETEEEEGETEAPAPTRTSVFSKKAS